MKIREVEKKVCNFGDLENGTVFKKVSSVHNELFLKTEESYPNKIGDRLNAVRLVDGELFQLKKTEEVIVVECELVIG